MRGTWLLPVILVFLCAVLTASVNAAPQPVATAAAAAGNMQNSSSTVENVAKVFSAIAWPLVVFVAILFLNRPFGEFLRSVGGRATKLSVFQVAVELSPAPEFHAPSEIATEFREATSITISSDSTSSLFRGIDAAETGEYLTVDLGTESQQRWLTSRLYIFTVMLERMRGVHCVVFTKRTEEEQAVFLGYAASSDIRWRLAMKYPWLERAYAAAYAQAAKVNALPEGAVMSPFAITSVSGRLPSAYASRLVSTYLAELQLPALPDVTPHQWVLLHSQSRAQPPTYEHAKWIEPSRLTRILRTSLKTDAVPSSPDLPKDELSRMILRRSGPFVARTTEKGRLTNLIHRNDLLEALATREGFSAGSSDGKPQA